MVDHPNTNDAFNGWMSRRLLDEKKRKNKKRKKEMTEDVKENEETKGVLYTLLEPIEAIQWDGTNILEIKEFMGVKIYELSWSLSDDCIYVEHPRLDYKESISKGDFVVKHDGCISGYFSEKTFLQRYRPIEKLTNRKGRDTK